MNEQTLDGVRAAVRAAHALVTAGRYAEAHAAFSAQVEPLRALLGPSHPEVEELEDDLQTVLDMAGVSTFGQQMGYRWSDPTKGTPAGG
jgi:hypothetical protein